MRIVNGLVATEAEASRQSRRQRLPRPRVRVRSLGSSSSTISAVPARQAELDRLPLTRTRRRRSPQRERELVQRVDEGLLQSVNDAASHLRPPVSCDAVLTLTGLARATVRRRQPLARRAPLRAVPASSSSPMIRCQLAVSWSCPITPITSVSSHRETTASGGMLRWCPDSCRARADQDSMEGRSEVVRDLVEL